MFAVDLNYVKLFNPITVNIKGQYNYININKQNYIQPTDSSTYSFDNTTHTGFAQISIRPTGSGNKLAKNLEAAFRIGNFNTPANSLWGNNSTIVEEGLLYWFNWRTVLKLAYSSNKGNSTTIGQTGTQTQSNSWYLQFSIQL
jgi:hypothetical protein